MTDTGSNRWTKSCPVRTRLGDSRAIWIRPVLRQKSSNQLSSTVLPLPRGPIMATSCGGAVPPSRSARHRLSTVCSRSRPVSAGGATPVPGVKTRRSGSFTLVRSYQANGVHLKKGAARAALVRVGVIG